MADTETALKTETVQGEPPALEVSPSPLADADLTPIDPSTPPHVATDGPHFVVASHAFAGFQRGDRIGVGDLPAHFDYPRLLEVVRLGGLRVLPGVDAELEFLSRDSAE